MGESTQEHILHWSASQQERGLQKRKKGDVDDDEVDEEVEILWEVPKDLEDVVEEIVADLETETVSSTK